MTAERATYVGGSGTSALTFRTTVASTDTTTSALAITAVNLPSGASIKDSSGVAANLSGAVKTFSGLQIDPPSTRHVDAVRDQAGPHYRGSLRSRWPEEAARSTWGPG